jgi:hypothetical protein
MGPSALRNQGSAGVIKAARNYLAAIDLGAPRMRPHFREGSQLREGAAHYNALFMAEKGYIGAENTYFWETRAR